MSITSIQLSPRTTNGFGPGQAANLTVGPISGVDLDDLRFYNRGLSTSELTSDAEIECEDDLDGAWDPALGECVVPD